MRLIVKTTIAVALIASAALLAACAGKVIGPENTSAPTGKPTAEPTASAAAGTPSPLPTAETEPSASPEGSMEPGGSESASGTQSTDEITGFMEGFVVDPETVPELIDRLSGHEAYKDMAVQSITYKLYEGRQAYYVVLQGEGEASHPIYVFADGNIIEE